MSSKLYNNEEKLNVSAVLKALPRVNAPDNFEYNLMVRIQNQNFGEEKIKEATWRWSWFLAPGAALVFSIFLLLNIFGGESAYNEMLITDSADSIKENIASKQFIWALTDKAAVDEAETQSAEPEAYEVVLNSNDVVETKKLAPALLKGMGYDLDVILEKAKSSKFSRGRGTLVSTGVPSFNFDGFFIRIDDDSTKAIKNEKQK